MKSEQGSPKGVSFDEATAIRLLSRLIGVTHSCERMRDFELENLSDSMRLIAETHPEFWSRHSWLQNFWDQLEEEIAFRAPVDGHCPEQISGQLSFDHLKGCASSPKAGS